MGRPVQIAVRGALLCLALLVGGYATARSAAPTVLRAVEEVSRAVVASGDAARALSSVVVLAAAAALAAAWLWALACVVSVVHDELGVARGKAVRRAPSAFRPRLVRLLVGGVVGSAVALSVAPAHASESGRHIDPIMVAGLLLPDRPAGAVPSDEAPTGTTTSPGTGAASPSSAGAPTTSPTIAPSATAPPTTAPPSGAPSATASPATASPATSPATTPPRATAAPPSTSATVPAPASVTVSSGDTLWAIAETLLPATATDAAVDRTWRGLHDANRDVIGPDPDLIVPGTVLTVPTTVLPTVPTVPAGPPAEGGAASTPGDHQ